MDRLGMDGLYGCPWDVGDSGVSVDLGNAAEHVFVENHAHSLATRVVVSSEGSKCDASD